MTDDAKTDRLIDEVNQELGGLREAADRLDEIVARQFGLNRTDLRCIGILYRHGRMAAGELADESGLSPGAITTALDRIERAGYANRLADPEDRRRVLVISTHATRELGARLFGEVELSGQELLRERGPGELTLIRDYLRGTRELYERQAGHIAGQAPDTADPDGAPSTAAAPLRGITAGRLEFNKGAARVDVRGDAALDGLYSAHFEGPAPDVLVNGGTVIVQQRRRFLPFDWRGVSSDITLNATIPWSVSMRGGMWQLAADLRALRIDSLDVSGGASSVEIWLPAPAGTVLVRVAGGASEVRVHRPAGVPARADISGGASQLIFDGDRRGGVGGRSRMESPGYEAADDRYEMRFSGGASQVTIDTV
jgi:DNA-binding MarR family transcriptional regulator